MSKLFKKFFILVLIFGWIFAGWPRIFNFPPEVESVQAAITFERTPSETSIAIASSVSISVPANYPDDLIYDGSSGSVGLTREPLLNMKWWGIAAYTETENFISKCVPTTSPLPPTVFNLRTGDYKIAISLAETKEGCEAFSTAEYPIFSVLEAANFNVK